MRILGLDYGSKTVGVAVSDPLFITAQSVETIVRPHENKLRKTFARLEELIAEYEVSEIVLGLPMNMDGTYGERVSKTMEFKAALEKRVGLNIVLQDERLTTISADRVLEESGVRSQDRKQYIDKIAAAYILQAYLDARAFKKGNNNE